MKKILLIGLLSLLSTEVTFAATWTQEKMIGLVALPLAAVAAKTFFPEIFSLKKWLNPETAVHDFTENVLGKTSFKTATDEELQNYLNSITDKTKTITEKDIRKYLRENSTAAKLAKSGIAGAITDGVTPEMTGSIVNTLLGNTKTTEEFSQLINSAQDLATQVKN